MEHDEELLKRFEELLCSIATGTVPNRSEATLYSSSRADLLRSPAKDLLPGFIYQCLTIFKFKEFITLFDPDTVLREAFVRNTFDRCRSVIKAASATASRPPPVEDRSDPRRWVF